MSPLSTKYGAKQVGQPATHIHRIYITDNSTGAPISPFHDIPLSDDNNCTFNMVVEIPRGTNAKMEISKDEWMNPIKQDVKKGALRYVKNCFPHHGYPWNYGALPQTWESPEIIDKATGLKGDNDPIDAIEIGTSAPCLPGTIKRVKVIGAMALLDEGETDWKVIVLDVEDKLADKVTDIGDLEKHCPGLIEATRHWFKVYKVPDGKALNEFAFNGQVKDRAFALKVINETHAYWKDLYEGRVPPKKDGSYEISVKAEVKPLAGATDVDASVMAAINAPAPREIFYI